MPTIEVKGLTKVYRVYRKREGLLASLAGLFHREYHEVRAVDGVSFTIEEGEMVAFLGPNGAGKTTTLKLLSGLIFPTSGDARVLGYVPWKRENAYRRRFSLVMGQKNQLWWDLPAQESFRLHKEIYRIDSQAFQRRLDELTELLEVRHLVGQPVRELSLGERMRMELIAALLHSPQVLLLDEPTIGLDVVSQRKVQNFLKYYQAERKITVLLTSHYMKDVEALCERAIIINHGQIKTRWSAGRHRRPLQPSQADRAAVSGGTDSGWPGTFRDNHVCESAAGAFGGPSQRDSVGPRGDSFPLQRGRCERQGSAAGRRDCRAVRRPSAGGDASPRWTACGGAPRRRGLPAAYWPALIASLGTGALAIRVSS